MTDRETHIDRVDPPHWYAGMTEPVVLLMVYGRAIGSAEVTIASFEEASEPSSDECPEVSDECPEASDECLKTSDESLKASDESPEASAATSSKDVSHSGGVRIDRVVRTDSPNYLIVYLNLEGVSPGTLTLRFTSSAPTASRPTSACGRARCSSSTSDRRAVDNPAYNKEAQRHGVRSSPASLRLFVFIVFLSPLPSYGFRKSISRRSNISVL